MPGPSFHLLPRGSIVRCIHSRRFGALTALFNPSNSETVLIISALFVTYLHSLFLHPFFLHPFSSHEGFFQHSLPSLDSCTSSGPYALDNL